MQIINKSMQRRHRDADQNISSGNAQRPDYHFHTSDLQNFKRWITRFVIAGARTTSTTNETIVLKNSSESTQVQTTETH